MEARSNGKIDQINVKAEHEKLIDLYFRLELLYFVKNLLYRASQGD